MKTTAWLVALMCILSLAFANQIITIPINVWSGNSGSGNLSENVSLNRINATTSAGLLIESVNGADVALLGAGGGTGATFYGGTNLEGYTQINNGGIIRGIATIGQIQAEDSPGIYLYDYLGNSVATLGDYEEDGTPRNTLWFNTTAYSDFFVQGQTQLNQNLTIRGLINGINISTRGNLSGAGTTGQVATYVTGSSTLGATTVPTCTGGQALTALGTCSSIGNVSLTTTSDRILFSPTASTINATQFRVRDVVYANDLVDGLAGWARKPLNDGYSNNYFARANDIYNITAFYWNNTNTSQITNLTYAQISALFDGTAPSRAFSMPANHTLNITINWGTIPMFTPPFTSYWGSWRGCWYIHSRFTEVPLNATFQTTKQVFGGGATTNYTFSNYGLAPYVSSELSMGVLGLCSTDNPYNDNVSIITIQSTNGTGITGISEIQWFPQEPSISTLPAGVTRYTNNQMFQGMFWMRRGWSAEKPAFVPVSIWQDGTPTGEEIGYLHMNTRNSRVYPSGSFQTWQLDLNNSNSRFNRGNGTQVELYFQAGTTTGGSAGDGISIGLDANANGRIWQYEARNLTLGTSNTERMHINSGGNIGIGTSTPNQRLQVSGNVNVSGTVYYGALVANSPHAFGADNVGYTRICKKATNGVVVIETVELVGQFYQNVIRQDTEGVCEKVLFDSQTEADEIVEQNSVPVRQTTTTTIYRNIWTGATNTTIQQRYTQLPQYLNNSEYGVGDVFIYEGVAYEVLQAHRAQDDWIPSQVPALYKRFSFADEVTEWRQPQGAHDCYPLNALVTFQGATWKNTGSNCNIWQPGVFGWVRQ